MKKHILGVAIFSLIVAVFVSVWAVFGYLTQPIPVVPKVESDRLPVFKSDKRKSCRLSGEKLSYVVSYSTYSVDTKTIETTLRIKWNGYGDPPKKLYIAQKLFTANNEEIFSGLEEMKAVNFDNSKQDTFIKYTEKIPLDRDDLEQNLYTDFTISDDLGNKYSSNTQSANQVIVVHGESSVKKVVRRTDIIKP